MKSITPTPRGFQPSAVLRSVVRDYVPLVGVVLVVALPLVYILLSSFKDPGQIVTQDLVVFPSPLHPENYADAADAVSFPRLFLNSLIVTVIGAGLKVVLAVMTAYGLVFVEFPGKRFVFWAILATLMVPPQVSVVPNYVLISSWGGGNTYWGLILPGLGTAFGTFLLRQAFMALPYECVEAAKMDGAGHLRRLWNVIVPMSLPSITTVGLVSVVFEWNEYLWPLVLITNPSMMTLPVGLTLLHNSESAVGSYGVVMAGMVMAVLPVLVLFVALQRHIVTGMTQGGVKA